ncbi:20960_t:CDS:2 [Entrophospora sp. SA101]|nr:20609_t:CDS:2 [Entrophospora sp. SA101]CAJ0889645.1 20960_t:CDS:2 [Entrophospora sp. SA101]
MKPGEFQQKNFTAWQTEYNQAATTQRLNWKKEEGQALIIENNAPSPKTSKAKSDCKMGWTVHQK